MNVWQLILLYFYFQNLFGSNSLDGGSSPMIKPKGDKQVEYLDLDLDSGKSTPPRKVMKPHFIKTISSHFNPDELYLLWGNFISMFNLNLVKSVT